MSVAGNNDAMQVDKSAPRVRRMFGEIAGRYDLLNHLLSLNIDRYWRWRTVRIVPPDVQGPILDLCTGTGDLAIAYARRSLPSVPVVGADFCHEMLVLGSKKGQRKRSNGQLAFVEANALALPFPEGHFQIVSVAFGLRNVSDTDAGLREMVRVCRAGGRVAVLEFSMPRWQPFRGMYGFYFRRILPRIGQLLVRNQSDAYNYLPESVASFPEGEALVLRMRGCGLHDVRERPLSGGIATLYVGTK